MVGALPPLSQKRPSFSFHQVSRGKLFRYHFCRNFSTQSQEPLSDRHLSLYKIKLRKAGLIHKCSTTTTRATTIVITITTTKAEKLFRKYLACYLTFSSTYHIRDNRTNDETPNHLHFTLIQTQLHISNSSEAKVLYSP